MQMAIVAGVLLLLALLLALGVWAGFSILLSKGLVGFLRRVVDGLEGSEAGTPPTSTPAEPAVRVRRPADSAAGD